MIAIIYEHAESKHAARIDDCRSLSVAHDCRATPLQDCRASWPAARRALPPTAALRPHPLLRSLALDDEHSVAFVPSYSQVAVLNRAARDLLARLPLGPGASLEDREAAEQLAALGLLSDGTAAIPPPAEPEVLLAWLHLTNACNLRCGYCYIQKSAESMRPDTARASVDALIRAALRYGYPAVALKYAGGEASLRMDLVEQTQRYAREQAARHGLALSAGLLSNGTLLTPGKLAQVAALGLRLMISLDGMSAANDANRPGAGGRGSTEATMAGIAAALDAGLAPEIAITVTAASVDSLPDLLGWLLERDLVFSISFYRDHGGPGELAADEDRLIAGMRRAYATIAARPPRWSLLGALLDRADLSQPHRRTCAVGESYLVIDQRGRLARCQMALDQPVGQIDAEDPLGLIRLDQAGVQNPPVEGKQGCQSCEWRYWCAGGCPVAAQRAGGRYDAPAPSCAIYQRLFPDVIRLEGLRLLRWRGATARG